MRGRAAGAIAQSVGVVLLVVVVLIAALAIIALKLDWLSRLW